MLRVLCVALLVCAAAAGSRTFPKTDAKHAAVEKGTFRDGLYAMVDATTGDTYYVSATKYENSVTTVQPYGGGATSFNFTFLQQNSEYYTGGEGSFQYYQTTGNGDACFTTDLTITMADKFGYIWSVALDGHGEGQGCDPVDQDLMFMYFVDCSDTCISDTSRNLPKPKHSPMPKAMSKEAKKALMAQDSTEQDEGSLALRNGPYLVVSQDEGETYPVNVTVDPYSYSFSAVHLDGNDGQDTWQTGNLFNYDAALGPVGGLGVGTLYGGDDSETNTDFTSADNFGYAWRNGWNATGSFDGTLIVFYWQRCRFCPGF